jgi:hypothetical protein
MITQLSRLGTHARTAGRQAGARLGRLAAVLAAAICGLLASAAVIPAAFATMLPDGGPPYVTAPAVVPAAFARMLPDGGPPYPTAPAAPVPASTVHVITAGGMAGWQITLIAVGAALLAAAATILVNRVRAARRAAPAPTA